MSSRKAPVILASFTKFEFSRHILEKGSNTKFHQNTSCDSRVVPCGRTDRHCEANNRFSQFCQHLKTINTALRLRSVYRIKHQYSTSTHSLTHRSENFATRGQHTAEQETNFNSGGTCNLQYWSFEHSGRVFHLLSSG
jgi:hypothetical protein